MADVNHVIIIGRLTKDILLKFTGGGMAIGSFSIAVNRRTKKGEQWVEEASFFDVSLFGKSAEGLSQYLTKGKQVAVEGELRQDRWEQDGQNRSKVYISASNVQLLGGNDAKGQQRQQTMNQARVEYNQDSFSDAGNFTENIPF